LLLEAALFDIGSRLRPARTAAQPALAELVRPAARQRWRPQPVVLLHGFLGFRRLGPLAYFSGVQRALEADGFRAHTPRVNPLQRSAYRAYQWFYGRPPQHGRLDSAPRLHPRPQRLERCLAPGANACIADAFLASGRPVLLIAHSQGCRDARYLLSPDGLGDWRPFADRAYPPRLRRLRIRDCVAALATVAGAHNGMRYAEDERAANWILRLMAEPGFNRFVSLLSAEPSLGAEAVCEHGRRRMLAFNRRHRDPDGLRLYSVAGLTDRDHCTFFLKQFYDSLRNDERFECEENDGLVNLSSAVWPVTAAAALERLRAPAAPGLLNDCFRGRARNGRWTFLGTICADHVEQIGLPFAWPAGRVFRHLDFYRGLARLLARDLPPDSELQPDGTWSR
jgi:hypothetical protein